MGPGGDLRCTRLNRSRARPAGWRSRPRRLGVSTEVVAEVGEDAAGERIRRELTAASVGVEAVTTVPAGITPMTVAFVRLDGERAFISDLGRLRLVDDESMPRRWPDALTTAVVALVGTSNLPGVDYHVFARLSDKLGEPALSPSLIPGGLLMAGRVTHSRGSERSSSRLTSSCPTSTKRGLWSASPLSRWCCEALPTSVPVSAW